MKCIILSDSHRSEENIRRALAKNPDADTVFFLGDGIGGVEEFAERRDKQWVCVLGNCDRPTVIDGSFVKKVESVTLFGKKIVLTHGDLYGAKYGSGGLLALAKEEGAVAVLYGHTHVAKEEYFSDLGVTLFNPGSLEAGWGTSPSFGLLTVSEKGELLFSHGTL